MKSQVRDTTILKKVMESIEHIENFTKDVTCEEFLKNEMLKHAVTMALLNIGELIHHLSKEFKANTKIPHEKIVGLRNLAAHGYHDLKFESIWGTIKTSIPELKTEIKKHLQKST